VLLTEKIQLEKKTILTEACRKARLTSNEAMGTQLIERGMQIGDCGMCWNAEHPDTFTVHQAYRYAGCRPA